MAKSSAKNHVVVVVRESGSSQAVVDDPRRVPWSVHEVSAKGERRRPVKWHVVILAPTFESHPVVFESREVAKAWVGGADWASAFNWDSLQQPIRVPDAADSQDTIECTVRYFQLALERQLSPDSRELFECAHEVGLLHSLACHPLENCTGYPHVPTPGKTVLLPWTAYSCQSSGWSDLWDASGQQLCALRGDVACEPIPLGATAVYTS
jgi:hypothetical protein